VANILVYIELVDERPAAPSLEALGEGRRIASFLGATLYAVVPTLAPARTGPDDVAALLSRHGADKVILVAGPDGRLPALYATHGHTLTAALGRVPAALVLLAATPGGRDLAPRTAARLGAAYVPEPSLEYGAKGVLVLSRPVYGGGYRRRLAADELERPLVVTLTPGAHLPARGDDQAEIIVLKDGPPPWCGVEEVARTADPGAALETARVVVTAGAGLEAADYALARDLACALGGEVAVTRAAVERGLDTSDREVGVGGRRVAPRLYVACAASGSPDHLAAVPPDAQIVAINRDPSAPIFRVAAYGIVGEFGAVAPALIAAARRRGVTGRAAAP
jgi:electron transfer flavoprotein alpha subunit